MEVQDVSFRKRAGRDHPLGCDAACVNFDQLSSAWWERRETREAGHLSTNFLDLNVRQRAWPHESRQAEGEKLGAQTHFPEPRARRSFSQRWQ